MTELVGIRVLSIGRYPYRARGWLFDDDVLILHVRDVCRASWAGDA